MTRTIVLLVLGTAAVVSAQTATRPTPAPERSHYWSMAELHTTAAAEVIPKARASDRHIAGKRMLDYRTHTSSLVHRVASHHAEQHEGVSDYWIVVAGTGTLVLGGEIVDRTELVPGEYRGPSIRGGEQHTLGVGDQVNIPPMVPHQVLLDPGQSLTYTIVKINVGMYPWTLVR
ncbi:MAG TPA: hypothetical protein VFX28_02540 [Methylomirabilota bacterium]|nr:hypothetical protein [Methylomirabilota bacterium]